MAVQVLVDTMATAGIGRQVDQPHRLPFAHLRRSGPFRYFLLEGDFAARQDGQLPMLGRTRTPGTTGSLPARAVRQKIGGLRRRFGSDLRELVEDQAAMMMADRQGLEAAIRSTPGPYLLMRRSGDRCRDPER